jgi:tRNA nucleotidyltransferase/poly(A) polymerase
VKEFTKLESLQKDFPHLNFSWQEDLREITDKLKDWFFVGGCVRDSLLSVKKPTDIDITTKMSPDEIENQMRGYKMITIGKKFGTVAVFYRKYQIEITTTRLDVTHYGRKADVQFGASFFEDSCRRDFTINSLLFNEKIIDYHNGIEDLQSGKVKFIGDAVKRIKEDYLRILRYIRFFLRFEKQNNISYTKEITSQLEGLCFVSTERIFSEIEKMFYIDSKRTIYYMNFLSIPQTLFNESFSMPLYFSQDPYKNLAYSIYHWKNHSFPLNKTTKSILNLKEKYDDYLLNCAWIWYKKGEDFLKDFLDLRKAHGKSHIIKDINTFKKEDLSRFYGADRGDAEIAIRYLFLSDRVQEDINETIQYIRNNLKK